MGGGFPRSVLIRIAATRLELRITQRPARGSLNAERNGATDTPKPSCQNSGAKNGERKKAGDQHVTFTAGFDSSTIRAVKKVCMG
jgi:hypothetical protein